MGRAGFGRFANSFEISSCSKEGAKTSGSTDALPCVQTRSSSWHCFSAVVKLQEEEEEEEEDGGSVRSYRVTQSGHQKPTAPLLMPAPKCHGVRPGGLHEQMAAGLSRGERAHPACGGTVVTFTSTLV